MKEHRGFKYKQNNNGKWILIFPNGFKSLADVMSEEALKAEIDKLVEKF